MFFSTFFIGFLNGGIVVGWEILDQVNFFCSLIGIFCFEAFFIYVNKFLFFIVYLIFANENLIKKCLFEKIVIKS
jgi:hypothetical protein